MRRRPLAGWLPEFWRRRWIAWMTRRIPPAREITLSQKNIFIMPSGAGFAFICLLLALLITGINYESNLVLAIAFLLGGVFVVAILHTYANLAGLRISASGGAPVFAGEEAAFSVTLRDEGQRAHDGIGLWWSGAPEVEARLVARGEDTRSIYLRAPRRGRMRPPRLRLRSYYPLGLLRAWSWLDLEVSTLVYPRPAAAGPLPHDSGSGDDAVMSRDPGAEDFSGFRNYAPGDPLRHVAWKTLAKGQPLQTREYVAGSDRRVWLDWEQSAGHGGVEERLSLLCRWVLELDTLQAAFGLLLPGVRIEPAAGEAQRDRALTALALFGSGEKPA
jgi:uncharacterized protein (DUF58 family)